MWQTLILIDQDSSQDAISEASAKMLNAGARVRVTSVDHINRTDFDGMTWLVLACPIPQDDDIQQAARDVQVVDVADVPRMVWFHQQSSA